MLTYFFVVLLTLFLFSVYMLSSTEKYLVSKDRGRLYMDANVIANALADPLYNKEPLTDKNVKIGSIDTTGTRLLVCDKNMTVLYDSSNIENWTGKTMVSDMLSQAIQGEDVDSFTKDEEHGYYLEVGVPIIRSSDVLGAVILNSSLQTTQAFIDDTRTTLLFITVVISIIIGLLSSFIAELVTSPVEKLIAVTKSIATGNFDRHVKVTGTRELMELADAFNSMTDKLNDLEQKRQMFVSDASHELKTPLSGIKLVADSIMQMDVLEKEVVNDFLTDMNSEVDRLTRIVDRLLKLTKTDTVSVPSIEQKKVSINDLVHKIMSRLRPIALKKRIKLEITEEVPAEAVVVEDKIYEAIYNIVDNAIKYSEMRSKVQLAIKKEDDTIRISVTDTGIGIPEGEINDIFERFYRVDKARARDTGGTGLGLAIALDAVRYHGGKIEVSSREGEGSTFTIILKNPKQDIVI